MNRLLITVFSDASFAGGIAGFHYWFKSSKGSQFGSGSADGIASIAHAELLGIQAGLFAAAAAHPGLEVDYLVQCDSVHALGILVSQAGARIAKSSPLKFPPVRKLQPAERALAHTIRRLAGKSAIFLKHVKGHSKADDPRSFLNKKMDKGASLARKNHQAGLRPSDSPAPPRPEGRVWFGRVRLQYPDGRISVTRPSCGSGVIAIYGTRDRWLEALREEYSLRAKVLYMAAREIQLH